MEKVGVGGSTIKEGEAGEERKGISPSVYKCACRKNTSPPLYSSVWGTLCVL